MIKGGFQGLDISGVDLTAQSPTLPGAYATCAGADGKPIRVQTADGQVECSVKKVSTNYVLAGVTGDGKILSITIGSTNGISVSEMVPGEVAEEYLDTAINISSASSTQSYVTEYDGIVKLYNTSAGELTSGVVVTAKLGATHTGIDSILRLGAGTNTSDMQCCFVKKGTILYCSGIIDGVVVRFFPYKPVQS